MFHLGEMSGGIKEEIVDKVTKRRPISPTQKRILFEFMSRHPELQAGKFTQSFTSTDARILWEQVTIVLNSAEGPKKVWSVWRKTWQDLKTKVKKAAGVGSKPRSPMRPPGCSADVKDAMDQRTYYTKKLELMSQNLLINARKTKALESIAQSLSTWVAYRK